MGKRRRARELAIKVLFHLEYSQDDPAEAFDLVCKNFKFAEDVKPFAQGLVLGVYDRLDDLDAIISETSRNWRLERIAKVDRCILRLAAFELLHRNDIPPKVSINEAVDLAKKFGSEESGAFINGILDKIYNTMISGDRSVTG